MPPRRKPFRAFRQPCWVLVALLPKNRALVQRLKARYTVRMPKLTPRALLLVLPAALVVSACSVVTGLSSDFTYEDAGPEASTTATATTTAPQDAAAPKPDVSLPLCTELGVRRSCTVTSAGPCLKCLGAKDCVVPSTQAGTDYAAAVKSASSRINKDCFTAGQKCQIDDLPTACAQKCGCGM
jgi:hypothetical protein